MLNMLQVAGRELLAEEFFSLFELLHGLQQDGQVVDGLHGLRVLVPQLEAPCGPSLAKKTDFLNQSCKGSGSCAINSAAGTSPNRIHTSFTLYFTLHFVVLFLLFFLPEVGDTLLASNRGLS